MLHVPVASSENGMEPLREELSRRRARRYRRRRFRRWRRRRLILQMMAVEYELADPRDQALRDAYQREADRIGDRLAKNATRLYR